MEYLGLRDLFNMAFLSNTTKDLVTIEMVVRATLFRGGNAKKSLDELLPLIKDRSIYPPSPLRLLRLSCGKRCELCLNAVKYEHTNTVYHTRKGYGLMTCWRCTTKRQKSKAWKKDTKEFAANRDVYNAIFDHRRTTSKTYGWRIVEREAEDAELTRAQKQGVDWKYIQISGNADEQFAIVHRLQIHDRLNYLWRHTYTDREGEKCGPILTYAGIKGIARHVIRKVSEAKSSGSAVCHTSIIDKYFYEKLKSPDLFHVGYTKFIDAYKSFNSQAKDHIEDMKWAKISNSWDWKTNKICNCIKLVKALRKLIKVPGARARLVYKVNPWFLSQDKGYKYIPAILLRDLWMRTMMLDYIIAPASALKSADLTRIANDIVQQYRVQRHKGTQDNLKNCMR